VLRPWTPLRPLRRIFVWWNELSPQGLFVASFALLIAAATAGLLWLPGLYVGPRLGPLDALFTATSAVCVTGLIVVDTATYFTFWGQLWLLAFIQLGGLGLFSLTTLIIGGMGRRLSLRSEVIAGVSPELTYRRSVVALTFQVARFTLLAESAGALVLFFSWVPEFGLLEGAWHAVFHAISAFCNAGFSTFSDSLMGFSRRPFSLLVVSALVIAGGLGFLAIDEVTRWYKGGAFRGRLRLSSHTTAATTVSATLLLVGAVLFAIFEWNGVLAPFGPVDKVVNAWFMSVTPRTAGFNAISYAEVGNGAAYLTVLLMAIGGSPGSTAGGIKTTALAVLGALAFARIRGRRHVVLHGRSIPEATVERTVSLALIAFVALTAAVFVLSALEARGAYGAEAHQSFLPHLFEATSALATVGLSMDVTGGLGTAGRALLIPLMFMGRVGPLAFFAAISLRSSAYPRDLRPAREDIIVG
jgi:trk system potassium uptake protein TrkH